MFPIWTFECCATDSCQCNVNRLLCDHTICNLSFSPLIMWRSINTCLSKWKEWMFPIRKVCVAALSRMVNIGVCSNFLSSHNAMTMPSKASSGFAPLIKRNRIWTISFPRKDPNEWEAPPRSPLKTSTQAYHGTDMLISRISNAMCNKCILTGWFHPRPGSNV